jgi:hypothetical protein
MAVQFQQSDLDALRKAYATGARSVTYSDGSGAVFNNESDLWKQIQRVDAILNPPARGTSATKALRVRPGSGIR